MIAGTPADGAEAAYRAHLEYAALSGDRERLLHEVLFHPVSQEKLHAAAAAVLRRWSQPVERCADLMQEAALDVLRRFRGRQVGFPGGTVDEFLGWHWTLWHNACRSAWRRIRNDDARQPRADGGLDHRPYEEAYDSPRRADRWPEVLQAILEIDDDALRETLIDWAAGLNGAESARRRGVSRGTISKRRRAGVRRLQERLADRSEVDD